MAPRGEVEKRRQIHPAPDGHVVTGNARGLVLLRHGIGNGYELRGPFTGQLFGPAEEPIAERILIRIKRRPVNRMDDHRHSGPVGRKPADEPGLPRMGVNHIILPVDKKFFQRLHRPDILKRVRRAPEFIPDDQRHTGGPGRVVEGAFRAGLWASYQLTIIAQLPQSDTGSHGIFLGPADNQPRNYVTNFHLKSGG